MVFFFTGQPASQRLGEDVLFAQWRNVSPVVVAAKHIQAIRMCLLFVIIIFCSDIS